jgi:hypothetical protein
MIERRNAAFGASGAPVEPERRIRNTPQQFHGIEEKSVTDSSAQSGVQRGWDRADGPAAAP